jgi:TonB family protein
VRALPVIAFIIAAASVAACAALGPEPHTCSAEIVTAAEMGEVCTDTEREPFASRLTNAFESVFEEVSPQPYQSAHLMLLFGTQGVSDYCVVDASGDGLKRRLEAALAGFQQRYQGTPPACAVGARRTIFVGTPPGDCVAAQSDPRPHLVSSVPPRYPPEAERNRQTGEVYLRFTIQPDGSPSNIEVVSSSPPGVFDEAAKEALAQWRYCPVVPGKVEYPHPHETGMRFDVR